MQGPQTERQGALQQLQRRGVLRVAISYAVIAWLLLQIGDVVLEPLGAPAWVMRALIVLVAVGFPVALVLAWFFELTPTGIERDALPADAVRPTVPGMRRYADVAIIGVLLVAVVVLLAREGGLLEEPAGEPVIGVLPFTELGVGTEDRYFGDGIADTLTYKLGQLQQLIVLAPTSTFQFRGADLDLFDVGSKLGATALLQGTVQRAGGMMRVSARLVDTATGRQMWSGSYDRREADIFTVQDEIAGAVTQAMNVVLGSADQSRLLKAPTESLTAYDAFLLGQSRLASRRREEMIEAVSYFRQAIERDPQYALAHAALVEALYLTGHGPQNPNWKAIAAEARRAAAAARELDPELGEAWLAEALVAMGDNELGAGEPWPDEHIATLLKRASELSPNSATVLKFLSNYSASKEEALVLLQRAAQLDPRSGIVRVNIAEEYLRKDDYARALEWQIKAAQATEPYFSLGYAFIPDMFLIGPGRADEAARWARAIRNAHPEDRRMHAAYSRALVELGAWDEARSALEDYPRDPEGDTVRLNRFNRLFHAIRLETAIGEFDTAAELAETMAREYWETTPSWPDLSTLASVSSVALAARALADIQHGRAEAALERYRTAWAGTGSFRFNPEYYRNEYPALLRPPVLIAVLHRLTGDAETGERMLRDFLAEIEHKPVINQDGIGFTRFTIHAFLGDTDSAIRELEAAMDAGWVATWWG